MRIFLVNKAFLLYDAIEANDLDKVKELINEDPTLVNEKIDYEKRKV